MKAIKQNKVYTITETEKSYYVAQGYDILNDEGEVIERGAGKSISYEEYLKLKDELDPLKDENYTLKQENEKLKEENKKLKAENKELKKSLV
ncbi:hypothetical protein QTI42_07815 [Clostridium perfringens]|uniref:hypothetical protein n=1 Tax=Bacillota TaxID=1239 RepID=UPI000D71A438|nr:MULTISPECIES: hypothetical protein [Bacillota]MDU2139776.1 hypothetical protein [Streptococcus mitis]QTZ82780.1 hypothetical protein phiCpA_00008 [Clostridium phage phiCp-A]EGT0680542.1 hypothetical protein [Clostridium perfringens]MBO3395121.1 hypothetical protein [Clostridium perfringens]MBO3400935.1 hypothetical protein [Clostridium perfringens]